MENEIDKKSIELPTFFEIIEKIDKKLELNPLEQFIYNNEPAGPDDGKFRRQLVELIVFAVAELFDTESLKTDFQYALRIINHEWGGTANEDTRKTFDQLVEGIKVDEE